MINLSDGGAYLLHGTEIIEDNADAQAILASKLGSVPSKEEAAKGTMAYSILEKHNTSGNMEQLQIKFDMCQEVWWSVCTSSSGCNSSVCKRDACRRR